MGLGQITFADLARAARRSRGLGQTAYTMGGSIPPLSSPCYNPTDTFAHFFGAAGADENACLANNEAGAAIVLNPALSTALSPGLPVGYDPTTGTITGNTTGVTESQAAAIGAAIQDQLAIATQPGGAYVPASDPCTSALGFSCTTLALIGVAVFVGFMILKGVR